MDRVSFGMPIRDFAEPGGIVQSGDMVSIPRVYGMSVGSAQAALSSAGFQTVVGVAVSSGLQAGLVVGTQPPPQSRALRGSTVTIYTSTGVQQQAPPSPTPTKKKRGKGGGG